MTNKKIILVDFDGTLHAYTSGWQGADVVGDPPVEGAIEWLREMLADARFDVQIYSSRSRQDGGIRAMKEALIRWGLPVEQADAIPFPTQKPAAFLTIDDRAVCFEGVFPTAEAIDGFVPWNKPQRPKWWDIAVDEAAKHGVTVREAVPMPLNPQYPEEGRARGVWVERDGFKRGFFVSALKESIARDLEGEVRRSIAIKAGELQRDLDHSRSQH